MGLERERESTFSNTELGEFFGPRRAPGRELSADLRLRSFVPIFSVATPAEPRGEKKTIFLCKLWAVKNFKTCR